MGGVEINEMKVEEKEVDTGLGKVRERGSGSRCTNSCFLTRRRIYITKQSSANLTLDYGSYMRNARFEISVIIRRPLQSPHHLHQSLSCSPFPFSPRVLVILHLP